LWYLGTLVPMIGVVQVGSHALADRYTYIPLIGLFIIIAWGVSDLTKEWHYRQIAIAMSTGVLLLIFMTCTWFQVRHWENSITLYKHTVKATPDNPLMHVNLGVTLHEKGRLEEAISHYSEALKIRPNYAKAHYRLGFALDRQGKIEEAISHYSEALRIKSNYDKGYYHLGRSEYLKAHYYLGNALIQQGNFKEAIKHFSEVLRIRPDNATAHFNLGFVLTQRERFKEAISHYSEAVRLDPHFSAVASYNIACIYSIQDKIEESINSLKKAIEKGYNNWDLIKTDKELENIRGSSYYKELIAGH
ncbi:tetratricopeptide repeat protein, partial [Candidatus Babeliales bacterium]|nr:tetratricopeptide repeat protein [Candidatus Babeliales bacterium]